MSDSETTFRRRALVAAVRALTAGRRRRFDAAADDPRGASERNLLRILRANAGSEFGRKHGFASIRRAAEYRAAVPIRTYDDHEPDVRRIMAGEQGVLTEERVDYFGQSSGTTGAAKYVPITPSFLKEVREARSLLLLPAVESLPGMLAGKALGVSSPRIVGWTEAGIPYGSVTVKYDRGGLLESAKVVPHEVYALEDFEAKYYLILRLAAENDLSVISTVNPSTVVLLARKLNEYADRLIADLKSGRVDPELRVRPAVRAAVERRIRGPRPEVARRMEELRKAEGFLRWISLWPKLAAIFCWKGGSAPFYLRRFPEHFGATKVYDLGFAATEGFFSAPLSPEGDDGVLAIDAHHLEFVPEARIGDPDAPALDASELERGGRYGLVFTTSAGLYRYDIGDVIEVAGFYRRTPTVRFLHKAGGMVSITGEKMGESHVVRAMDRALAGLPLRLAGFTCALDLSGADPRYQVLVEPEAGAEAPDALLRDLLRAMDRELGEANVEYRAKRDSLRLAGPKLVVVAQGAYERYRKGRLAEGAHDSHVKTPHLARDEGLVRRFEAVREVPWPD